MSIRAYYNDNDPKAVRWLNELIAAGLITPGDVDDRPIEEVRAKDLEGYTRHHFFAGIGGWDAALQLAGWPDDVPVWTGSCPCQPLSGAGKRQGEADDRHLWPAFYHLIAESRPPVVFGEQVAGKLGLEWVSGVRADLEDTGYACGIACIPACGVGAPQRRERVWWVADAECEREGRGGVQGLGQDSGSNQGGPSGESRRSSTVGGMGNADGTKKARQRQHGWEVLPVHDSGLHGTPGDGGKAGAVADAEGAGGRPLGDVQSEARRGSGMGDADAPGSQGRGRDARERAGQRPPRQAGEDCGAVGNAAERGEGTLDGQRGALEKAPWPPGGPVVWCRDGKYRRVKPGVHLLVDGVPGRVGRLRGYGNAIVPQVAAVFIRSYVEAVTEG